MLDVHLETVEKLLVYFIRDTVYKNNFKNGIVGVSGGIDSAVVLALTQRALGSEHTFALLMPYKLSSKESLEDGKAICEQLNVGCEIIDISPSVDAYFERFPADNKMLIGNKCARERMSVLFDFSARKQALVVGTSNKSELLIGYSTLFGDSAAAFLPLGDLYKTQVFALARYLDIPGNIVNKKPTADLWKDQTDEGEIGMSYMHIDAILRYLYDKEPLRADIDVTDEQIGMIARRVRDNMYKEQIPFYPHG